MHHRFAFVVVDKTMKDIVGKTDATKSLQLFGGKTVLLGGDFRQVLPVIPKGKRPDVVQATINRSYIWDNCKVFMLIKIMRVKNKLMDGSIDSEKEGFNKWLLEIGNGTFPTICKEDESEPTWVRIPDKYLLKCNDKHVPHIVQNTYPTFDTKHNDDTYLSERAILAPFNETADEINDYMTELLPGDYKEYKSCDEICQGSMDSMEQMHMYPTKFLNGLTLKGLSKHLLRLKVGMPVILLRNFNPSQGLCNRTRLIVNHLGQYVIQVRILIGKKGRNEGYNP